MRDARDLLITLPARVPRGEHTLPLLPYDYDALEPQISGETLRIHHQVHHAAYVEGLNEAELARPGAGPGRG